MFIPKLFSFDLMMVLLTTVGQHIVQVIPLALGIIVYDHLIR